jgi:hypothetical protein
MSRYDPLRHHLASQRSSVVRLTFAEVEALVGPLPASATRYPAWWANDRSHTQAAAWLDAGWRVEGIRLGRWAQFTRSAAAQRPVPSQREAPTWTLAPAGPESHGPAPGPVVTASRPDAVVIIPCSASKARGGFAVTGSLIINHLSHSTRVALEHARAANRAAAHVDESRLMPAFQRYTGALYEAAGESVVEALREGWAILILSGGYGIVTADEPIGYYDARFELKRWPADLIGKVIVEYAADRGRSSVIALAGRSTPYAEVIRRIRGRTPNLSISLLSPQVEGGGALVKTPRAIGEALRQLLQRGLGAGWESSEGVRLIAH